MVSIVKSSKKIIVLIFSFIFLISIISASPFGYDTAGDTDTTTILTGNLTQLGQLTDVTIPSPSNNEILTFNSTTGVWESLSAQAVGDTNETTRFNTLVGNCSAGDFISGVFGSGDRVCNTPPTTSNIFDQVLNTTSNVTFNNITVTENVSASWFLGIFNWILGDAITNLYLTFNGTTLTLDESVLNTTIDERAILVNATMKSYVDDVASDTQKNTTGIFLFNNTNTIFLNETRLNITIGSFNDSMKSYVDSQDSTFNNSLKAYLDSQDTTFNNTLKTYLDSQDITFNNTMKSYVDAVASDTQKNTSGQFLFNDSTTIFFNFTFANDTYVNVLGDNMTGPLDVQSTFHANQYLTDTNSLPFNFYDDGSEMFMNVSTVEDVFNIETENSKLALFNSPSAGNDFKVMQVFSKEASDVTEFVVTKAGFGRTSYFIRSLALVGNGTAIPTPFNCTSYASFIDCGTDVTGADFFVEDDIENWGSVFFAKGLFNVTDVGNTEIAGNLTTTGTIFWNNINVSNFNISMKSYVDGRDTLFNNTMKSYVDDVASDTDTHVAGDGIFLTNDSITMTFNHTLLNITIGIYNDSQTTYTDAQDTTFNNSLKAYLDSQDINFNTTMTTYVDAKDTTFNNSMKSYVDDIASDTQKNTTGNYLYNNTLTIFFNETRLNITLDSYNNSLKAYLDSQDTTFNNTMKSYVDDTHTVDTDTNETERFNNLTAIDCAGTNKVVGVDTNGTVKCAVDLDSGASNIFDQVLNTTSNVTFNNITVTENVSASWFLGIFNWFVDLGGDYITFNGSALNFSETKLNTTIEIFNDSIKSYVDSQDTTFNNTLKAYLDSQDITFNNTMKSYVDAKDVSVNLTLKNYLDAQDTTFNNTLKSYLDSQDTTFNTTLRSWSNDTFLNVDGSDTMEANLNISFFNVTSVDCIIFKSGGEICST